MTTMITTREITRHFVSPIVLPMELNLRLAQFLALAGSTEADGHVLQYNQQNSISPMDGEKTLQ